MKISSLNWFQKSNKNYTLFARYRRLIHWDLSMIKFHSIVNLVSEIQILNGLILQTIRSKQTQKTGFEDVLKKTRRSDLLYKNF